MSLYDADTGLVCAPWQVLFARERKWHEHGLRYEFVFNELDSLGYISFDPNPGPGGLVPQLTEDGWNGEAPHDPPQRNRYTELDNPSGGYLPAFVFGKPFLVTWTAFKDDLEDDWNQDAWVTQVMAPAVLSNNIRYAIGSVVKAQTVHAQYFCAKQLEMLFNLDNRGRPRLH